MTIELWSGVLSSNAAKVRIALAEKGLAYAVHEVPWTRARLWHDKPDAFLAVSPRSQVPVLIDDGFAVHDSTVIVEYLEERYPDPPLFPAAVLEKTKARLWEDEADYQQQHIATLISEVFLAAPGTPRSTVAAAAIEHLTGFFDRFAEALADQPYVCGEFSAADVSVFMIASFGHTLGLTLRPPAVEAWYARMLARPSVKAEFEAIMAAAAVA